MTTNRQSSPDRRDRRASRFIHRAGRLVLLAFPEDFRARQGRALVQTIAADVRGSSLALSVPRLIADLTDAVRAGIAERVARRRRTSMGTLNQGAGRRGGPGGRWIVDLRHAWRSISARPGSSAATVMVFSLGVGLATAMFALADPYFLRRLPYADPDALAVLRLGPPSGGRGAPPPPTPTLDAWRARTDLFDGVAAHTGRPSTLLRTDVGLSSLTITDVTENFFEVLGIGGRLPRASSAESTSADMPIALASRGREKVADADVASGRILGQDGRTFLLDGSIPDGFLFPGAQPAIEALSAFTTGPLRTIQVDPSGDYASRRGLTVIARLKPGVTPTIASESLTAMMSPDARYAVVAEWLSDVMTRRVRPLAMGAIAAGLLILVVCAGNLANLFAARGAWQARESATREALGATRLDIVRLRALELGLTASIVVVVGLGLAWFVLEASSRVIPTEYVTLGAPAVTGRVVVFAALAALVVAAIAFVPLLTSVIAIRHPLQKTAGSGRALGGFRFVLTALQAALSLVLAVGAAMLVHSYMNLRGHDLGVDRTSLTVVVSPPHGPGAPRRTRTLDAGAGIDRLRRIPGVEAASAERGGMSGGGVTVNGDGGFAHLSDTWLDLFDAAGMRILRGRALAPGDEDWRAVVVNEAFVRERLSDRSPVGQVVQVVPRGKVQAEIVGVVRDVFDFSASLEGPTSGRLYGLVTETTGSIEYVLRVTGDPSAYVSPIRNALAGVHPEGVIGDVETVDGQLAQLVRDRTFATLVLTLFAVAAGAVTFAGLVGMVSFLVARRTREIAIRMAIGARPAQIRRLVVRDTLMAACMGAVIGLFVGRWLSTWLESFVFGIKAGDWTTALMATVAAVTLMVLGALLPARRAVRLQPTDALRVE